MVKKMPAWIRNMNRNDMTPLRSWRLRYSAGSTSTPSPRLIRRPSQDTNPTSTRAPAKISQITGESPSHAGAQASV